MELENKKYFELTSEERKQRNKENWQKAKPIVKRVCLALFCIAICLLMVFALLHGMFDNNQTSSDEHDHDHGAIVIDYYEAV